MGIDKAIKKIENLTNDKSYGDLFQLIEAIRQGHLAGDAPRIGQMGALFRLNCKVLQAKIDKGLIEVT